MKFERLILTLGIMVWLMSACSTIETIDGQKTASQSKENVVRYRENIDSLSPEKLAAYEHAVAMMKKKSERNVFDRTGFLWQAWVHNCTNIDVNESRQSSVKDVYDLKACDLSSLGLQGTHKEHPGMCEHAKDTFFQWHRAEFYFYEKSLQNADPLGIYGPSTKDVTVPYWNFTKAPSGDRYPKEYEDKNSTLYVDNRKKGALPEGTSYTSPHLLAHQLYNLDWSQFGGYPVDGKGNYGEFESQIHNPMHSDYVRGYLSHPPTAGLDPLFYAFHSYIDYIFEKWIQTHGSENITSGRFFARGEQSDKLPKPIGFSEGSGSKRTPDNYTKNMGRGEIYYDTIKQGYAYNQHGAKEFLTKQEMDEHNRIHLQKNKSFGIGEESYYSSLLIGGQHKASAKPNAQFTSSVSFAASSDKLATPLLDIVRSQHSTDYSFQADVYLYPGNITENIADEKFRRRYLVVSTNYWELQSHHQGHQGHQQKPLTMTQVITDTVQSIRTSKQNQNDWKLTVAISSDHSGDYQFEKPLIRY